MPKTILFFSLSSAFFLLLAGSSRAEQSQRLPATLNLRIVGAHPHDRDAFTQGLIFENGLLYESTGEYGNSSLRLVEPATGKILKRVSIPKKFFSEGIALVGNRIYMLTWQEGYCFVFDKDTFQLVEQFRYSGEGWGLAFDGKYLIMSDGSATLKRIDPKNFKVEKKIQVQDRDAKSKKAIPVRNLNELEFIRGEIWANVWQSPQVVRIDPESGKVLGWVNCSGLVPEEYKRELLEARNEGMREHVLNGIAFDAEKNRVFLTGKNWPTLHEIEIIAPRETE